MEPNRQIIAHDSSWPLWQLLDSAFPTGGFAHSSGLEAAVQLGRVQDVIGLSAFTRATLDQLASFAAPFVIASAHHPEQYASLDETYHASLRNTVASAASCTQGKALIATAIDAWPDSDALRQSKAALRTAAWRGHWPVAFGFTVSCVAALDGSAAADAFLFMATRSILSAAVRLNLVGPREAQRLHVELAADRTRWLNIALHTHIDDAAAQTSPILDMLQAQHGRLYSKLFVS